MSSESPSNEIVEGLLSELRNRQADGVLPSQVDPSLLVSQQFADMSPTARQDYSNKKLVKALETENEYLKSQINELNRELGEARLNLLQLDTLRHLHRSSRGFGVVASIGMTIGGALISTFKPGEGLFSFGWGLLLAGSILLICKSVFNW